MGVHADWKEWTPVTDDDTATIRRILNSDRRWAAYALADLQPAFAPYCTWRVGSGASGEGVVLLFDALAPPVLFTMGPVEAVEAALVSMSLPDAIYLNVLEEHLPLVKAHYGLEGECHPMWRMVYETGRRPAWPATPELVRLVENDAGRIVELYAHGGLFAPDSFDPYQLAGGVFFGVCAADGALAAAGGTHIVDWQAGIAAIGNMYTRPDQRRRGLAGAILDAIVYTLSARAVRTIVLNVDQRNHTARTLYERHGFRIHTAFVEGIGKRSV
jgi:ribosomal protein S18 acetylase RimI-like enzyme